MESTKLLKILKDSGTKYKHVFEAKEGELEALHKLMKEDEFYPSIHITGYSGLVADPGALIYANGTFFLYYLWSPYHWIHGLKHWCLVSTKDFVNYKQHGAVIIPSIIQDKFGVYSGAAMKRNDMVEIYFTANEKGRDASDEDRKSIIGRTFLDPISGKTSHKKELLWTFNKEKYTPHFRDPKPFFKESELYFLVAAQTTDKKGNIAVFKEAGRSYRNLGDVKFQNHLETGFMLERPEFMQFENWDVIIISPEGVEIVKGSERVTCAVIGNFNTATLTLDNNSPFIPIDYGHDYYVPSIDKDDSGRYISIGWFGISRVECHPTSKNNWSHAMGLPREMTIEGKELLQKPAKELEKLRGMELELKDGSVKISNEKAFELLLENNKPNFIISLENNEGENVKIIYENRTFTVERMNMSIDYYPELGTSRTIENILVRKIQIFIDASFLEIFLNDGEKVMSSRIFIKNLSNMTFNNIQPNKIYKLKKINTVWKNIIEDVKDINLEFEIPYYK